MFWWGGKHIGHSAQPSAIRGNGAFEQMLRFLSFGSFDPYKINWTQEWEAHEDIYKNYK